MVDFASQTLQFLTRIVRNPRIKNAKEREMNLLDELNWACVEVKTAVKTERIVCTEQVWSSGIVGEVVKYNSSDFPKYVF